MKAEAPNFAVGVGDNIQGGDDRTAAAEWRDFGSLLKPFRAIPFYPAAGNHDVWSEVSAAAYRKATSHPLHYSFDYGPAHFTVLDNSRTEHISDSEITFLEADLKAHGHARAKFVVFHRPSWIMPVLLGNPEFPLHRLLKRYGVQYVVCGHVHQVLRFELEGITYLSVPSAGGHLRSPKTYEAGWFFGQTLVKVNGSTISAEIRELGPPYGEGRVTTPEQWGAAGLRAAPTH